MGRHSAGDADEVVPAAVAAAARPPGSRPLPVPRGRHAVDADDEQDSPSATDVATLDTEPVPDIGPKAAPKLPAEAARKPRRESGSAQDLAMLRADPALRNRVAAAVLVPFVLLAVVLVSVGELGSYFDWSWIPLISAGVLAGLLLDVAQRRIFNRAARRSASTDDEPVLAGTEGVDDGADVADAGEVAAPQAAAETGVGEGSGQVDET
jgi:hypothetical protein